MRTKLVAIGNSRGVRLPKAVIEQCALDGKIELIVQNGQLVIRGVKSPRAGWDKAFKKMREKGDDFLIDPAVPLTEWDSTEWTW
ncbi:MAG: AbrB/MazE/SpoVT family DNA-binding domain-containing protein [Tepidisphaeraceae bacterium]|jgi:antitoxin MazE